MDPGFDRRASLPLEMIEGVVSDKLVPDKLRRHGHVTIGAGRDFPQFPTVQIHSTARDRQVNHNSHLNKSLYASCTREYATGGTGDEGMQFRRTDLTSIAEIFGFNP